MGKTAPDGSIYTALDVAGKGLHDADGYIRMSTTDSTGRGAFAPDGSLRVKQEAGRGRASDGSLRITVGDSANRGRYMPDGSLRVTDTDAEPFVPTTDLAAKLIAWWDAADLADGAVSSWVDKISSINPVQATGANQPTRAATSFNTTFPGVTFDGTADHLGVTIVGSPLPTGSTPGEIFVVATGTDQAGVNTLVSYGDNAGGSRQLRRAGTEVLQLNDASSTLSGTVAATTTPFIGSGFWKGTEQRGYLNGTPFTNNPGTIVSLNTAINRIRIGSNIGNTASSFFGGVIAQVMITLELTAAERDKLTGWLAHNYGLTGVLPVGHPYKTNPP